MEPRLLIPQRLRQKNRALIKQGQEMARLYTDRFGSFFVLSRSLKAEIHELVFPFQVFLAIWKNSNCSSKPSLQMETQKIDSIFHDQPTSRKQTPLLAS